MLWSLAAGPLVNVALLPILGAAYLAAQGLGWAQAMPDAYNWLGWVLRIDLVLLVFNILPIYPLDGGQILRSLLWFFMGRARSLVVATVLGFVGAAGLVCLALWMHSTWSLLIAGYMLLNCWGGLKSARAMIRMEKLPRREGFACPNCGTTAAGGTPVEMRPMQADLRHVRNHGRLSAIAELSSLTPCAVSASRCIPSASGRPLPTRARARRARDRSRISRSDSTIWALKGSGRRSNHDPRPPRIPSTAIRRGTRPCAACPRRCSPWSPDRRCGVCSPVPKASPGTVTTCASWSRRVASSVAVRMPPLPR